MSSALKRQQDRRAKLLAIQKMHTPLTQEEANEADLSLSSITINESKLKEFLNPIEHNLQVSEKEIENLLESISSQYKNDNFDALVYSCKNSIISNIAITFGLGELVSQYDKDGGNVTTIHNAQQGIYANDKDKYKRDGYTNSSYTNKHKEKEFIRHGNEDDMTIQDQFSGKFIGFDKADIDHVISTKHIHNNGGFMLDNDQKKNLANAPENLAVIDSSANRSKGSKGINNWHKEKNSNSKMTNQKHHGHDKRRTNSLEKKANNHISKGLTSQKKIEYYAKKMVSTGIDEAKNSGIQRSFGLLLNELLISITDEIIDIYRNGITTNDDSIILSIKTRITNIAKKIVSKWKNAVEAFKSGAISAFFSNLITSLINMFVTTLKDTIRLIREGFFTILEALKIALFPPPKLTKNEANDAALKILTTGIVSLIGISFEAEIKSLLVNIPYATQIANIVCGASIGIVSTLLVYQLEKLDIFGIDSKKRHNFIMETLHFKNTNIEKSIEKKYNNKFQ